MNNMELHQTVTGPNARGLIKDENWITRFAHFLHVDS